LAKHKIQSIAQLAENVAELKKTGKKAVMCHGVFDLLHPGHIRHLQVAKNEGDILAVTLTPDHFVNKGPGRPAFSQHLRAESLAALNCVDFVAINEWPTAVEAILKVRPDIYVKGSEYSKRENDVTGKITEEEEAIRAVGGRIHFTDEVTFSSSNLINSHFSPFPPETEAWLRKFRAQHSLDEVLGYLDKISRLKVLVIGEAILDEYVFCHGLGKSSKDPILAFQYRSMETYAGGSLAVANHAAGFSADVSLITQLGESDRREEFVVKSLRPHILPTLLTQSSAPTIHKRRFVDTHTNSRLFELYLMEDVPLSGENEIELVRAIEREAPNHDLVISVDYGHGMMTPAAVKATCAASKFLALNTQANAGNRGFNTVSKYPRADYVCLAGHEVALETRMRHAPAKELLMEVTRRIDCTHFTITQGQRGTQHYSLGKDLVELPALATRVADRVGAGDAVLAITSMLVSIGAPWDIVGFIGNVAGAQMVADLGNRVQIGKISMTKHITALMK